MSNNNMYNLGSNKPLINREQNYVLDRKLLSVHSEDRDISKWPHACQFEIELPETINNVQSLRLIQMSMPNVFYTFSNQYQNTKMTVTTQNTSKTITINEGTYTGTSLAAELKTKLNTAFPNNFNVSYNVSTQKFSFTNTVNAFTFDCSATNLYTDLSNCDNMQNYLNNNNIFNQSINWGLPYYLGFDKQTYTSVTGTGTTETINAPHIANIGGDKCIYMEVEKYNSYDELYPYTQSSTTNKYDKSSYAGKVNSAFAKIPISSASGENSFDSRTLYLQNITHYEPPIERISRLKFAFRFHDGRLVDFQNCNFDFTIEFNSLKNEIGRSYNIRIPSTYLI
jgi:hypothetical protein